MFGLEKAELAQYFSLPSLLFGKSIQRSYNFYATFLDNPLNKSGNRRETGPMPIVRPWHILSVNIPAYKFNPEVMTFGQVPATFPILDFQGFQVTVTLEEDEFGTIEFFISWCQRNIIDREGYYIPPNQNRIGHLIVEVTDPIGVPVLYYTFKDIYYLGATEANYDYATNDPIRRNVTFGVDRMETMFTKYTAINSVQKGITNVITAIPSAINNMAENNKAVKMGVDRNTLNAFNKAIRPV